VAYLRPYRVAETATTTGTGAITLAGAVTGYSSFAAELANADTATIVIEAIDAAGRPTGDWEVCDSTFTAPATLSRGTIKDSSAGGSRVNFAAGSKRVFAINPRDAVDLGSTDLIGTLPIAKGGTGQTTKAAAFNALSPVTSTGDLILGNGVNSNTRLAIGANTYVLTSNGTTASWQPAAGGGGGVTSFSGGSTGLDPSVPTTGAVTLSGTLFVSAGGTGTTTSPSNGQLLIGNGGGYSVANLTAGTGITITNAFGAITIAATGGGGGATISQMSLSTSSGSFSMYTPSSTNSKPLIGYTAPSPTAYGAFYFKTFGGLYSVVSASISAITITPSAGAPTSYSSGVDFNSFPNTFYVYDDILACYGLQISNAALQTLFSDSSSAITSPSLKPLDASSGFSFTNPSVSVLTSSGTYDNQSGLRGVVISKISSTIYILEFGSGNPTFNNSFSITSLSFNINSSPSTYSNFSDFSVSSAENTSSGKFSMTINVSNGILTTLLANSFL
jgi:hypothetical protein